MVAKHKPPQKDPLPASGSRPPSSKSAAWILGQWVLIVAIFLAVVNDDFRSSMMDHFDARVIKRVQLSNQLMSTEALKLHAIIPFQGVVCQIGPDVTSLNDGSSAPFQDKVNDFLRAQYPEGLRPGKAGLLYVNEVMVKMDVYDADEGVMFMTDANVQKATIAQFLGAAAIPTCTAIADARLFKFPSGKILLIRPM